MDMQKKLKNLPNRITLSRILMAFIFVALANIDHTAGNRAVILANVDISADTAWVCHVIAYVVAILAGLTDLLDGYLARKYKIESDFGRLLDPLADKIFVVATFVVMAEYRIMPGWIVIVVLTREFMVTGLRMLASNKGIVIAADKWGKIKTCLQMGLLALGGLSWIHPFGCDFLDPGRYPLFWKLWYLLLLIMAIVTICSGIGYFRKNKELFAENT